MKLNNQLKAMFVDRLERKIYAEKIADSVSAIKNTGDEFYNALFSPEIVSKMKDLPESIIRRKDEIEIIYSGVSYSLVLSMPMPIPRIGKSYWLRERGRLDFSEYKTGFDFIKSEGLGELFKFPTTFEVAFKKVKGLIEEHRNLIKDSEDFVIQMNQGLKGIRTLKSLITLDSSIAEEWEDLMSSESSENLPCVIPTKAIEIIKASRAA